MRDTMNLDVTCFAIADKLSEVFVGIVEMLTLLVEVVASLLEVQHASGEL